MSLLVTDVDAVISISKINHTKSPTTHPQYIYLSTAIHPPTHPLTISPLVSVTQNPNMQHCGTVLRSTHNQTAA